MSIIMAMVNKHYELPFTLLILQNEDALHTKQQQRYASDLFIDIVLKTKNTKSIIIIFLKCPKNVHTHTHTNVQTHNTE